MNKKTVALLFGGVSSEYDVSCMSVSSVWENIDREKFEPVLLGITKASLQKKSVTANGIKIPKNLKKLSSARTEEFTAQW